MITFLILLLFLDYKKGFGGKFGVQSDRKDKSAVGWEEREQLQQHESQKGTVASFVFFYLFRL